MEEKQKITIKIANQSPFPLTINRDDEEIIRKAERDVNELWEHYCQRWPQRTPVEVLGIVAFQYARYYLVSEAACRETSKRLGEFDKELDRLLGAMAPEDAGSEA